MEKGAGSVYHKESYAVDYELYKLCPQRKIIWDMLEIATGQDVANVAKDNEIDKMKDSVLHDQYMNRESVDLSTNKYVTVPGMLNFISQVSEYISNVLYEIYLSTKL